MPVEAAQECFLVVEVEAVGAEFCRPEAEADTLRVCVLPVLIQKRHLAGIKHRAVRRPWLRLRRVQFDRRLGGLRLRKTCVRPIQKPHAVRSAAAALRDADVRTRQGRGCNEHVLNVPLRPRVQPRFTVQTAVCQIVDHKAEWRDFRIFCAVQPDSNLILHTVVNII